MSTATTWWWRARSASIEPHTREVWVKPWASTRRAPTPSTRWWSVREGVGAPGGGVGGVVDMGGPGERTDRYRWSRRCRYPGRLRRHHGGRVGARWRVPRRGVPRIPLLVPGRGAGRPWPGGGPRTAGRALGRVHRTRDRDGHRPPGGGAHHQWHRRGRVARGRSRGRPGPRATRRLHR